MCVKSYQLMFFQISKSISTSLTTLQFVALFLLNTSIYLRVMKNNRNALAEVGMTKEVFAGRNLAVMAVMFLFGQGLLESMNIVELVGVYHSKYQHRFLGCALKFCISLMYQNCHKLHFGAKLLIIYMQVLLIWKLGHRPFI